MSGRAWNAIGLGLLWVLPHGLAMAGAHDTSVVYVVKNSAWHLVEQGIGGALVALAYQLAGGARLSRDAVPATTTVR